MHDGLPMRILETVHSGCFHWDARISVFIQKLLEYVAEIWTKLHSTSTV